MWTRGRSTVSGSTTGSAWASTRRLRRVWWRRRRTWEVRLTEELLAGASLKKDLARRLFGDLAYRSEALGEALAESGILLVTERSGQGGKRQQVEEIALASLKREFRLGETLATTLVGLVTRIAAKICAYTYGFYINRLSGRPQGHLKELGGHKNLATHI